MDSMDEITLQANQLSDESLESTRRMLQMAEDTQETGQKTLVMLDEQGNKLYDIEGGLDRMDKDVKVAEKKLTEMFKCCGLCLWGEYCKKAKNLDRAYKRTPDDNWGKGAVLSSQPTGTTRNGQPAHVASGPYIKKIMNDAREDEMEENLGSVGNIIGNLKNMALDMGTELDKQNQQIGRISEKVELTKIVVRDADKRTKILLE